MTLNDKIDLAARRLREVLARFGTTPAVGWTGGKDSTVVLYLWRRMLMDYAPGKRVRAVNLDTGCKFPDLLAFRDRMGREWDIDLHVIHSEIDLSRYPLAQDPVTCCRDLKIAPLNTAIAHLAIPALLTGVRGDENPDRIHRVWMEPHDNPAHFRASPILEWTELDIWTFLVRESIPWCPLYDQGYRSLGCMPCTSRSGHCERSGRDSRKETRMDQLHSLGYF